MVKSNTQRCFSSQDRVNEVMQRISISRIAADVGVTVWYAVEWGSVLGNRTGGRV